MLFFSFLKINKFKRMNPNDIGYIDGICYIIKRFLKKNYIRFWFELSNQKNV
jgi:hypothetical protein